MKIWNASLLAFALLAPGLVAAEPMHSAATPDRTWPFDSTSSEQLRQKGGSAVEAIGVREQCLVLKGKSLLEVKNSASVPNSRKPFTLIVWFNPYNLDRGQQMIAAKNRYSLNEREWGIMVDRDQKLRLYIHQGGWQTAQAGTALKAGSWYQVGVVVGADIAELWLNGKLAGTVELSRPIPSTKAPLTFGGVDDDGRIWQTFMGALDEGMLFDQALKPNEMAALYRAVTWMTKPSSSL